MNVNALKVSLLTSLVAVSVLLRPTAPLALQGTTASLEINPTDVAPGSIVTAKGASFQPGTVGLHLDKVAPDDEIVTVEVARDGTFVVEVPIGAPPAGAHELIACRDVSPQGDCRETASARFTVVRTTTTTSPRTTTTSPRTTTTTSPRTTTTATARTTTTAARTTTTTRPASTNTTTTNPASAQTTTASPITTTTLVSVPGATSTSPPLAGATTTSTAPPIPTTSPAIALATSTTTQTGDLVSGEDPTGPDPTFDPTPQDLQGITTTLPPEFAAEFVDNEFDIELTHIEVTQGLQNLGNDFPLLADRPTAVRVYGLRHAGPATLSSAFLEVSREGQVLDILEAENNPVQFPESFTRISNSATPYFMLDPSYLEGSVTLRALAIVGDPTLSNDLNPADNLIETTVEFRASAAVTVHAFPLYLAEDGTSDGDNLTIHDASQGWIHQALAFYRLWPIAYSNFDPFNPVVGNGDSGWDMSTEDSGTEPFAALAAVHAANGYGAREISMGMIHEDSDVYWGGFAQTPGSVSWSKMKNGYSNVWPWSQNAGGIIAQETGHNAGLNHVPCAYTAEDPLPGELHGGPVDPLFPQSYSWPNCSIAPLDPEGFYGFDVLWAITDSAEPSIMTNDPSSQPPFNAAPFMSYKGIGKWLEPWHGCALLNYIGVSCSQTDLIPIDDDTPGQGQGLPPIGHAVAAFSCEDFGGLGEEGDLCDFTFDQPFEPAAIDEIDHELFVFATVDADQETAELRPGLRLDPAQYDPDAMLGRSDGEPDSADSITPLDAPWRLWDYAGDNFLLIMRNVNGDPIGVQTLDVRSANGDDGDSEENGNPLLEDDHSHGLAELLVRLPALADLASIEIVTERGTLATLSPGSAAPLIESFDVTIADGKASIEFTASDPDADQTYAVVQYRANGPWQVVSQPRSSSTSIDLAMLPGGSTGEFRLVVTDGLHQAVAVSNPVDLENRSPFAVVLTPATEFERPAGRILELRGSAIDLEDRADVATRWTSDIDGEIGSGVVASTRELSEGTHTITFSVIDTMGASGSDSIVVHIAPSDLAPEHIRQQVIERFAHGPPADDDTPQEAASTDSPGESSTGVAGWIIALLVVLAAAIISVVVVVRRRRDTPSTDVDNDEDAEATANPR